MTVKTFNADNLTRDVEVPPALPEFVTSDEFASILRISKRTLFRLRARGDLPVPVSVSTNIVRWRGCDVRGYLDSLKARKPRRRREPKPVGTTPRAFGVDAG